MMLVVVLLRLVILSIFAMFYHYALSSMSFDFAVGLNILYSAKLRREHHGYRQEWWQFSRR
jgi:hypothetical protein